MVMTDNCQQNVSLKMFSLLNLTLTIFYLQSFIISYIVYVLIRSRPIYDKPSIQVVNAKYSI